MNWDFLKRLAGKKDLAPQEPALNPSTAVIHNHPTAPDSPYEVLLSNNEISEDESNEEE